MSKPDFARDFSAFALAQGIVDQQQAGRLEAGMRERYAGETVKIATRAPITLEDINMHLRRGKPVRVIAADLGCSRATLYRHLGNSRKTGEN